MKKSSVATDDDILTRILEVILGNNRRKNGINPLEQRVKSRFFSNKT